MSLSLSRPTLFPDGANDAADGRIRDAGADGPTGPLLKREPFEIPFLQLTTKHFRTSSAHCEKMNRVISRFFRCYLTRAFGGYAAGARPPQRGATRRRLPPGPGLRRVAGPLAAHLGRRPLVT